MFAGALTPTPGNVPRSAIDARVGMMIFLASWGMTFLTLFFSFAVLRFQAPVWPPADVPPMPGYLKIFAWVNTVLMIVSSLAIRAGFAAHRAGRSKKLLTMLGVTMACGVVFLILQIETWTALWRPGMRIQDGTWQGLFYLLTAFHALHVVAGLSLYIWSLPAAVALARSQPLTDGAEPALVFVKNEIRLHTATMFWHFVDFAWLATFVIVYFT